jgi:hypothetical protein
VHPALQVLEGSFKCVCVDIKSRGHVEDCKGTSLFLQAARE